MIYLESFDIPKDEWQDWYFNTPDLLNPIELDEKTLKLLKELNERFPGGVPHPNTLSGYTSWYPWSVLYQRGIRTFEFSDITILYGGNGSGKSTLLNVMAQKMGLQRTSLYNRSPFFEDYLKYCDGYTSRVKGSELAVQRGVIMTSDNVFNKMLRGRAKNQEIDHKREQLVDEYFTTEGWMPKSLSCSKFVNKRLQKNVQEQSNGETAFNYFVEAIPDNVLILLDEPENSLSASWQMELAKFLFGAIRAFNCQLIIATHSPFLLSIPGAKIYNLDANPISTCKWNELENVRCYYELFKAHKDLFE